MIICANCGRKVQPVKNFSTASFIIGLLLFGIPGILYLIAHSFQNKVDCPVCGENVYSRNNQNNNLL